MEDDRCVGDGLGKLKNNWVVANVGRSGRKLISKEVCRLILIQASVGHPGDWTGEIGERRLAIDCSIDYRRQGNKRPRLMGGTGREKKSGDVVLLRT